MARQNSEDTTKRDRQNRFRSLLKDIWMTIKSSYNVRARKSPYNVRASHAVCAYKCTGSKVWKRPLTVRLNACRRARKNEYGT